MIKVIDAPVEPGKCKSFCPYLAEQKMLPAFSALGRGSKAPDAGANQNRGFREMKLPNGQNCDLGTKLEDYFLNPLHREGRHKARVFRSVLGITQDNAEVLRAAIRSAAASSDEAEARGDNGFGHVFTLRFVMASGGGRATVMTGWIVLHNEDFPRLTTCYII